MPRKRRVNLERSIIDICLETVDREIARLQAQREALVAEIRAHATDDRVRKTGPGADVEPASKIG